jgi:hypothetical protein
MLPYVVAPAQHEDRNYRPQQADFVAARLATGILQEHKSQFREGGVDDSTSSGKHLYDFVELHAVQTFSEIAISLASEKDTC